MAYTRTKAQSGKGFVLSINTGSASAPTWVPVLELDSVTDASKWETDDATNYASSGVERITTMFDGGEWKISGNRVSTDPGQIAMQAAYTSGALTQFEAVQPIATGQMTTGDTWAFYALVTEWNPGKIDPKKKIPQTGTLATSNGLVFTQGS